MNAGLVLASGSPRRQEMLRQLGLPFEVVPSLIEEACQDGELPLDHVLRLAEAKAREVGARVDGRWVIGADTIVVASGAILGKPRDPAEALDMLRRLSGKEHQVLTGFCVIQGPKGICVRRAVETAVRVKTLRPEEIGWYVGTGEPFDKAGAYAIQGIGSFMIEAISGSYTNVVGLPLCELMDTLEALGALVVSDCGFRIAD
jgi:septum formation protein